MGQELKRILLKREEIVVEQNRAINFKRDQKYKKILSPIKEIGLIEPLSVYREGGSHILLDGYLRLKASEELNIDEFPCFIYQSRDSYTFNAMRNELSPCKRVGC